MVRDGEDYAGLDWTVPTAVFLGNESSGLDPALAGALSGTLAIPMDGRAESLNVGVACAVVCFEAFRQRRGGGAAPRGITGGGSDGLVTDDMATDNLELDIDGIVADDPHAPSVQRRRARP